MNETQLVDYTQLTEFKVTIIRVKSPTKANNDLHNGGVQF